MIAFYTDGSRLTGNTEQELHAYFKEMKGSRSWYSYVATMPEAKYYPIFGNLRKLIMRDERVKYVTPAELIAKAKNMIKDSL